MQHYNEAEKCFFEDVREKKKAASGVHHKTGKNGYTGKILFPTDFMSRKEKYHHRKAGKVVTTNIFDTILPIAEFEALETHEQRNRLQYWRTKYSNKEIMNAMKIWNARFYKLVADLGLPKAPRTTGEDRKVRKAPIKRTEPAAIAIQSSLELDTQPVQEIIVNGLHLTFNGIYSPDQIVRQLLKFGSLLEGEEDQYYIELKLMQKSKKGS